MKKIYLTPQTEVIDIPATNIMQTSSLTLESETTIEDDQEILSRILNPEGNIFAVPIE